MRSEIREIHFYLKIIFLTTSIRKRLVKKIMDWERVLRTLVGLMKNAENFKSMTGDKKKDFVLQSITTIFKFNHEEKILLYFLIDLVIELDKSSIRIATKKCFSSCF